MMLNLSKICLRTIIDQIGAVGSEALSELIYSRPKYPVGMYVVLGAIKCSLVS